MWIKFEDKDAIRIDITEDNPIIDDVTKAAADLYDYTRGDVKAYLQDQKLEADQNILEIIHQLKARNPIAIKLNQPPPTKGMFRNSSLSHIIVTFNWYQ